MLFKFLGAVSVTCLLSTNAIAQVQSYNIDLDLLNNVPLSTEGGFALLPGTWNRVTTGTTNQRLIATDGVLDINSNITVSNLGGGINAPTPLLPEVYEDYVASQAGSDSVTIDNLDAGTYALVLYSWKPLAKTSFEAKVAGVSQGTQTVVSPLAFPGYARGQSLTTFIITVPNQNNNLRIVMTDLSTEGGTAVLNGIQLYQLLGTGGVISCVQTVPNSSGGTANIYPLAITTPGILPLNVGVLPGGLPPTIDRNDPGAIVCFASNFQTASADFFCPNDPTVLTGTRCIGDANLARVGTALPGGVGFITSSGTYSLDVDLASLSAQGINTSSGATLYFQMVYRDIGNPTCSTAVIRWTNSLMVTLP